MGKMNSNGLLLLQLCTEFELANGYAQGNQSMDTSWIISLESEASEMFVL